MQVWGALTALLAGRRGSVRLTWAELRDLVGELPPSACRHRAWWSGDRPHVRAWRSAGFALAGVVLGEEVTFAPTELHRSSEGASLDPATVLLVGCVKSKAPAPAAARDLYVSPLFRYERGYAEARAVPWFILSAEYGLVAPDEWISPYERYLPDQPASFRTVWGSWVAERLALLLSPLAGVTVEVHAGAAYLDAVRGPIERKGAVVVAPLQGLSMGQRLSWYAARADVAAAPAVSTPVEDAPPSSPARTDPAGSDTAAAYVDVLLDRDAALSPAAFLATNGTGLREPGLYSWWVDEPGARDLTSGLGLPLPAGLIYAGLAGATRWPSGKRSTNTLWTRIADMHLGSRHEFSTFRRTLGSILAAHHGGTLIDEAALNEWMGRHMVVRTVTTDDPDVLGRLEADVLAALDPPLNLGGMPSTAIRRRLSALRRATVRAETSQSRDHSYVQPDAAE